MDWPTPKDRAISNLFERYPPDRDYRTWARGQLQFSKELAKIMDWTDDDSSDWSFEEERPMTTHRSHHKKPAPTQVPALDPEPTPHQDPITPPEYQQQVLEKLDQIILCLENLYEHMKGQ